MEGKKFNEESDSCLNSLRVGAATITRANIFVQDTWQITPDTLLTPILRVDRSSLFGTNLTFNLGMTHHIGGDTHRRFKANIGTGYTEPGMGELYYNWEMYAGHPIDRSIARLGYYWVGNPNLRPEKSVNFDLGYEMENERTALRVNLFHNRIRNYLTRYFTGQTMDFHPDIAKEIKYIWPPDMIYSFRNIGHAEITGLELKANHKFNNHWSGRLGYTFLHAINKDDPMMPRRLLDRPRHKIDIGVNYQNPKGKWRAALWGDYYIKMLDSNTVAHNGNYYNGWHPDNPYEFAKGGAQTYETKTFGIWNLMVQKDLSDDAMIYFGIDNLFNRRDDDRALAERTYRLGVNLTFGPDSNTGTRPKTAADIAAGVEAMAAQRFIRRPYAVTGDAPVCIRGDYRVRWNVQGGTACPETRVTTHGHIGDAEKNVFDAPAHSVEQRLHIGADVRIDEKTGVAVDGSLSGRTDADTAESTEGSRGLNRARLEALELARDAGAWHLSLGRFTEPIGVTGYYYNKEYDGARAVWTDAAERTQVRLGYGDFHRNTGIRDSAYTHATRETFYRAPTLAEWLGYKENLQKGYGLNQAYSYTTGELETPGYQSLYQKLAKAQTLAEEKAVLEEYLNEIKEIDPEGYRKKVEYLKRWTGSVTTTTYAWRKVRVMEKDENGNYTRLVGEYYQQYQATLSRVPYDDLFDAAALQRRMANQWDNEGLAPWLRQDFHDPNDTVKESAFLDWGRDGRYKIDATFAGYGEYTGKEPLQYLTQNFDYCIPTDKVQPGDMHRFDPNDRKSAAAEAEARARTLRAVVDKSQNRQIGTVWKGTPGMPYNPGFSQMRALLPMQKKISDGARRWVEFLTRWAPEDGSSRPLQQTLFGRLGGVIRVEDTILKRDDTPALHRAAYMQVKRALTPALGVQAFYLRSVRDRTHEMAFANGDHNDIYRYDRLASVVGIGAAWQAGPHVRLSADWGRNMTDFGRMMNGTTITTQIVLEKTG